MHKSLSFESVNLLHLTDLFSKSLGFLAAQYNTQPYWSLVFIAVFT